MDTIAKITGWHGGEARRLLALAAPMTGTALVNMGMSITDTVMMGWLGAVPLAAGAVVSDLYSIVFYFMAGVLGTVAAVVAQAIGRKDEKSVGQGIRNGFHAALLLAVPAFVIVWNLDGVLGLFGIDANVIEQGRAYAHMMAFTTVAMLGVTVWRQVFAAHENPKVFLMMVAVALPVNGVLNYALMFGAWGAPEMGVAGAGLSSALVAAAMLAAFSMIAAKTNMVARYRVFVRFWRIDAVGVREMFRVGVPSGMASFGNVGIYLISTPIISLFGTEALAAHAITLRLAGLFYAIPVGLGQASTVRAGHAVGAGDTAALRRVRNTGTSLGAVAGAACLVVLVSMSEVVPGMILRGVDVQTAALAGMLIVLLGLTNLAETVNVTAEGFLRGMKDTRVPMMMTLFGYWAVGAPVMALAAGSVDLGALGVWVGLTVGVYATTALMLARTFRAHNSVAMSANPALAAAE